MAEWRSRVGTYAKAWNLLGAVEVVRGNDRHAAWNRGTGDGSGEAQWICASLTPDKTGEEMKRFAKATLKAKAEWLLLDRPHEAEVVEGMRSLGRKEHITWEGVTSWYGDRVAKLRIFDVIRLGEEGRVSISKETEDFFARLQSCEVAQPEQLSKVLLPTDGIEDELWRDPDKLKINPSAHSSDDIFLPHGAGTWVDEAGQKRFVYAAAGPTPNIKVPAGELGYGNALFVDRRGGSRIVRALAPFEVWRAHGHSGAEWRGYCGEGKEVHTLMIGCAQALPRRTAEAVVKSVACWADNTARGLGYDEDEAEAREVLRSWMKIWRANPTSPGPAYQEWLMQRKWNRAGGARVCSADPNQLAILSLVRPSTLSRDVDMSCTREKGDSRPRPGGSDFQADFLLAKLHGEVGQGHEGRLPRSVEAMGVVLPCSRPRSLPDREGRVQAGRGGAHTRLHHAPREMV